MLAMGRCEQDDFYLEEVPSEPLPELLKRRWKTKIKDIVPLEAPRLLVFFRNNVTKVIDIEELASTDCLPYLAVQERFNRVEMQPDGYGIEWSERAVISHRLLYTSGIVIPLALQDLHRYVQTRIVSASEACAILDCSRQNIDSLMRRGKLRPIRTDAKYKLFSKAEVMQRKKEL